MALELVLVRHAKSLHDEYVEMDMERHLAARGYADAAGAARWCKSRKLQPGLLVSSPAVRAYSTALIFANRYGYPPSSIRLHDAIYEAGVQQLMYVIQELPAECTCVFMFGHNPGFEDLLRHLAGPHVSHFPTCGVAHMEFNVKSWAKVEAGAASLIAFHSRG